MQANASFDGDSIWPQKSARETPPNRIVFIAGGSGVSTLVSILSHIFQTDTMPQEIHFFYAARVKGSYDVRNVLGLERLINLNTSTACQGRLRLYLFFSGHPSRKLMEDAVPRQRFEPRVMLDTDVLDVFGTFEDRHATVCFAAAPADMTEHLVELLVQNVGLDAQTVFAEEHESEGPKLYHANSKSSPGPDQFRGST